MSTERMLVPLHGFVQGDVLGVVVLVHDTDRVSVLAEQLSRAASPRVAPFAAPAVYLRGRVLDPEATISGAGLAALDRVDLVPVREAP